MRGLGRGLLLTLFVIVALTALSSIIQTFIDSIVSGYGMMSANVVLAIIFIVSVSAAAIVGGVSIRRVLKKLN